MAIYLQIIKTEWTKESRGNPGASLRAKVPEKLPVKLPGMQEGVYRQEFTFTEYSQFKDPQIGSLKAINENQVRQAGFTFVEEDHKLKIVMHLHRAGKNNVVYLDYNNWCQVKENLRTGHDWDAVWRYYKTVYNIYYGSIENLDTVFRTKKMQFCKDLQYLLY